MIVIFNYWSTKVFQENTLFAECIPEITQTNVRLCFVFIKRQTDAN